MAANVSQGRYPKRNRAAVNYEIDQSVDGDLDLDDGNISEELGEGSPVSAGSNAPVALANAHQPDAATPVEDDSELEDATFGSRKTKKRKIMKKSKARAQPKAKRPPKFEPFRLMDLPPELRLKVYEEALVDPWGVHIRTYSDRYESVPVHAGPKDVKGRYTYDTEPKCYVRGQWTKIPASEVPKNKFQLSPNLLAVSKTIHDEAVSVLWTQPFMFNDVYSLNYFLLMLRPETIGRLRDLTIMRHGWIEHRCLPTFTLLRAAPFLDNLRFDCRIRADRRRPSGRPTHAALGEQLATRLYKECYPFLKALVREQGTESILKVIKFDEDEFREEYYDKTTHRWVTDRWSPAREAKVLQAMVAELNAIMNRRIVPRFPRSR